MPKDVILTPEGLEKLKDELEDLQTTAAARSPSASRRRGSSATSRRTPSTTTPRTSRRCSRRGSPSSRSKLRSASVDRRQGALERHRPRRLDGPRQGREAASRRRTRSSARPRPTPGEQRSPTSRRSARRCIGRKRGDDRRGQRSPAAQPASSRSPRSTSRPSRDGRRARPRRPGPGRAVRPRAPRHPPRASSSACAPTGVDPFPHAFPGRRADRGGARRAHDGLEPGGRGQRPALPRRRPPGRPPRPGQMARSSTSSTAPGRIQLQARADVLGEERMRAPARPRPRRPGRRRRHRPSARAAASSRCASTDFAVLAKSLRPPPDKHHGLTDVETALPPPRAGPDRQRGGARALHDARAGRRRDPPLPRRRAASSRSRRRSCSRSTAARWRGRSRRTTTRSTAPLPAHRDRALPQAADRRRPRARLRDRQGLPQRGHLVQAQPRVHDARVVRGLRGLRPTRCARVRGGRRRGAPRRPATTGELDFTPPWRRDDAARRDPRRAPASTSCAAPRPRRRCAASDARAAGHRRARPSGPGPSSSTTCSPSTSSRR